MWPWKWDAPYDKAIERIAATGFRATELMAWNYDALDNYYTTENIEMLKGQLSSNGLEMSQFMMIDNNLSSGDAKVRALSVEKFKKGIDITVAFGAPNLNTVTHYPFAIEMPRITDRPHVQVFTADIPSGLDWRQNWNDYIAAIKEIVGYAESQGVTFSIEPHPFRYGGNTEALLRIIDAVDSPALGVNFDPSHLFPAAEIIHAAVYRLEGRIVHCHFSDNDGLTNVHWRPGKGKIDWEKTMVALKDTGFDGTISLELEDIPGVSRGVANVPGVYRGNVEATDEFIEEYRLGMEYLKDLAVKAGITVE